MIRLFRVFVPAGALALLVSEILLVTGSFILAVYYVIPFDPTGYLLDDGGDISILLVLITLLNAVIGLRQEGTVKSIRQFCLVYADGASGVVAGDWIFRSRSQFIGGSVRRTRSSRGI